MGDLQVGYDMASGSRRCGEKSVQVSRGDGY